MNFTKAITTRVLVITAAAVAVAASAASAESRKFKANGSYISVDGYDASGCVWTGIYVHRGGTRAQPQTYLSYYSWDVCTSTELRVRVGDDFECRVQDQRQAGDTGRQPRVGIRVRGCRQHGPHPTSRGSGQRVDLRVLGTPAICERDLHLPMARIDNLQIGTGSGQPVRGSDRTAARRIRRQP